MSTWTHVAGVIRLDSFMANYAGVRGIIEKRLGMPALFNGPEGAWDECRLPMGSEGSLEYSVVKLGDGKPMAVGAILIHGDLRDYESADPIETWLNESFGEELHKLGVGVRQGCVEVSTEGKPAALFVYNQETYKFERTTDEKET